MLTLPTEQILRKLFITFGAIIDVQINKMVYNEVSFFQPLFSIQY